MTDSLLHLSCGALAAATFHAPGLCRAWKRGDPLAHRMQRVLLHAMLAGIFAATPNILARAGLPLWFCTGWWMNLFLFNPLLGQWIHGGSLIGATLFIALCASAYSLILLAIGRASGEPPLRSNPTPSSALVP